MSVWFEPLRSYEGAVEKLARNLDVAIEEFCLKLLNDALVTRAVDWFDSMTYGEGRNQIYSRGQLISFVIIALATGKSLRDARDFVQASTAIRQQLRLAPPAPGIREKLIDGDRAGEDINESGFPTRQEINHVAKWLARYLKTEDSDGLDPLRELAYVEAPLETITKHRLKTRLIGIDGKRCASPNHYGDRRRSDDGAVNQDQSYGRWKMTAVDGDVPFAIASVVSRNRDGQVTLAHQELIPQIKKNRDRMLELARERRLKIPAPYAKAACIGDSAFRTDESTTAIWEAGLVPHCRGDNHLDRNIVGLRRVCKRNTEAVLLEQADDGTLYCPCSHGESLATRKPMLQTTHMLSKDGKAEVRCGNGRRCPHTRGVTYFVPWGGPTHDLNGKPIPDGDRKVYGVAPIWNGDLRAPTIIAKVENAIEHYHGQQHEKSGMGAKVDYPGRRRVWGNFANNLWWILADLIWNIRIRYNLDRLKRLRHEFETLDWRSQFHKAVRLWRNAQDGKNGNVKTLRGRHRRKRPEDALHGPVRAPGGIWVIDGLTG